MKIGIIGSGVVGRALGSGFARIGHDVTIGTRNTEKEELLAWKKETGGTLASTEVAAKQAEIAILATSWTGTREAVEQAGLANLQGKLLIDVTNPLDFSGGGPALSIGHTDSAGETVQSWIPEAKVVKCWNTITAAFMCDGSFNGDRLDMFIAGNDEGAKQTVAGFLDQFQWNSHDLGSIEQSRILEYFAMLWITYGFKNQIWNHAFKLIRK